MGTGKKIVLLTILAVIFLFMFFFTLMGAQKDLKFTILYDNYIYKEGINCAV